MPRKKNVVSTKIIEAGDVTSMLEVAGWARKTGKELDKFRRDVVTPLKYNIRARAMLPMLIELRVYPPKRDSNTPVRWKSEKQRKYVMMLLRAKSTYKYDADGKKVVKTDQLPYQRTFKLKRGWRYELIEDNKRGGIRVKVWNDAESYDPIKNETRPYHRFVTGDIGLGVSTRSVRRYMAPVQPFHKDTGWNPAYPIIQKYILLARQEAKSIYKKRIERIVK
jgi:hypothetical protein